MIFRTIVTASVGRVFVACGILISSPLIPVYALEQRMPSSWFHPPPAMESAIHGIDVPPELVRPVGTSLRAEAARSLAQVTSAEISKAEANRLCGAGDPDKLLVLISEKLDQKLQFFVRNPLRGEPASDRLRQSERQEIIRTLRSQLAQYNAWIGKLRPILVRAVAGNEPTGAFSGIYAGDTLLVAHGSLSSQSTPMHNIPVVVFLPATPLVVYTEIVVSK